MKIPKCPKSITGKHYFYGKDDKDCLLKTKYGCYHDGKCEYRNKCIYCGIIDDRKL